MADNAHAHGGNRIFYYVWLGLIVLTVLEVLLAYQHMALHLVLVLLLGLSIVKSALIMAYFMHLKFERFSLTLTLIPALLILLALMFISFPDAARIHTLAPR